MSDYYSQQDQQLLLRLARTAVQDAAAGRPLTLPVLETLPLMVQQERACFVTLHTHEGDLRGCTGTLVARRPLVYEVVHMAEQTALHDPRFAPVAPHETANLVIEISVLTPPERLVVPSPQAIPQQLRPGVDGVVLVLEGRRATFLPQVWERVPDPGKFLDLLCHKMGMPPGAWLQSGVEVYTYQSVVFEEGPWAN